MKSLLSLLILCAYGAADAAAPRLVLQSFRAPTIAVTSSRSLGIARKCQQQNTVSDSKKPIDGIKALADRLEKFELQFTELENDFNWLHEKCMSGFSDSKKPIDGIKARLENIESQLLRQAKKSDSKKPIDDIKALANRVDGLDRRTVVLNGECGRLGTRLHSLENFDEISRVKAKRRLVLATAGALLVGGAYTYKVLSKDKGSPCVSG